MALGQNRSQDVRINGPMGAGNSIRMETGFPIQSGQGKLNLVLHIITFITKLIMIVAAVASRVVTPISNMHTSSPAVSVPSHVKYPVCAYLYVVTSHK